MRSSKGSKYIDFNSEYGKYQYNPYKQTFFEDQL